MSAVAANSSAQATRGVSRGSAQARFVQRTAALGILVLPSAGVVAGAVEIAHGSVTRVDVLLLGVMYLLVSIGVTVGYHRHFAHRAFRTSRGVQTVLALLGSAAGQGPLLFWVATHRRHHAFSDRPGDPHSPNLIEGRGSRWRGFLHAHLGWMLSDEVTSWPVFARDLLRDPVAYRLHGTYLGGLLGGLVVPGVLGLALGGSVRAALDGVLWGGFIRMWFVNQVSWCVGSVSHMFGSRPFRTNDRSANNWLVALLSGGEGLQNNHHAFPSSALHGFSFWEPDWAGTFILLCKRLGLVWDVRVPTAVAIERGKRGEVLSHIGRIEGEPPTRGAAA